MTKHNHVKIIYTIFFVTFFLTFVAFVLFVTVNITSRTDYLSSRASMTKGCGVYYY